MAMYSYDGKVTTVKPDGWVTTSSWGDMSVALRTDEVPSEEEINRRNLARELEADAKELRDIDGTPAPRDISGLITGGSISGYSIGGLTSASTSDITWEDMTIKKMSVKIPAGTKFIQDPDTGEFTNVDDIEVEI